MQKCASKCNLIYTNLLNKATKGGSVFEKLIVGTKCERVWETELVTLFMIIDSWDRCHPCYSFRPSSTCKQTSKRKEMMQNTNILLLPESSNIGHKAEV